MVRSSRVNTTYRVNTMHKKTTSSRTIVASCKVLIQRRPNMAVVASCKKTRALLAMEWIGKIHSIHPCGPRVGLGWDVVTSDYLIITCTFPLLRGKFNHRFPYSGTVIEVSLTEAVSGCG